MAILSIPDKGVTLTQAAEIRSFLADRGILFEQWEASHTFSDNASPEAIMDAYASVLQPYMAQHGYQSADVISVNATTPNIAELRAKFLREHTHNEDEVRFFVAGQGYFWFNLANLQADNDQEEYARMNNDRPIYNAQNRGDTARDEMVFCVKCEAGDLLSVPAGVKHWFDLGPTPFVKTIRIFTDASGWMPQYTNSGIDARYQEILIGG
jgi:1,2-dihydroxy-3-keto-5-methylthiopentene dioxygenase